jgi:hypothetical protein
MMPEIPITSPLGFLGIFLIISAILLIFAGSGIITIKEITLKEIKIIIAKGRSTLVAGIILVVIGLLFITPDIYKTIIDIETLQPTAKITLTPTATITPAATITPMVNITLTAAITPIATLTPFVTITSSPIPTLTNTVQPSDTISPSITSFLQPSHIMITNNVTASKPLQTDVDNLPDIWSLTFATRNITQPGKKIYDIDVNSSQKYLWMYDWCAKDPQTLKDNIKFIRVKFYIDDKPVDDQVVNSPPDKNTSSWYCHYWALKLQDFKQGTFINLDIKYTLFQPLFDGDSNFPDGNYQLTLNIVVK